MADVIEYTETKWGKENPSKVAAEIGQGARLPTEAFGYSNNAKYRSQVVQAGGVDRILEFLLKTDQPFVDVKKGGDLPCPSIWLNLLNNFCQDGFLQPKSLAQNVQYKIIVNLGPLFQDMDNFEKRELFGSKDYWIKCLMFFCNMLYSLLTSEYGRIGDFLMKQRNLKSFLVRILFMEIGEPEVTKEILAFSERDDRMPKPDIVGLSQTFCISSIKNLMMKRDKTVTEDFGLTPIRPEDETDFLRGIIRLLEHSERGGWYQGGFAAALNVFILFFDRADRLSGPFGVDSCSEKLVPICSKYLTKYSPLSRDRFFYENMVTSLVAIGATLLTPIVKNKQVPIDYNVAKAVDSGLFDFFVDCCDSNDARLAKPLEGLIRTAVSTISLEETTKAMQARAPAIRARVERVKERHPVLLQELAAIEEILKNPIIKPPADDTYACEFCQEKTTPEKMKKCQFCKSVIYCSEDCQKLNWLLHQTACEEIRKEPTSKSLEELHAQGKILFGKHVTKLLLQAALKGVSILECVVVIDMCETTPLLKTYKLEEFAERYIQDEDAVTFSKKVMERNKSKGALTASFVGFTSDGLNASLITLPPSTAPLMPMVVKSDDTQKWLVAQRVVAQSSLGQGGLQKMQSNPRIWQMTVLKTMKP
jgi:hypothetical protein